jgi:hypothetical protein
MAKLNGKAQRPAIRQAQVSGLGRSARRHDNGTAQTKGEQVNIEIVIGCLIGAPLGLWFGCWLAGKLHTTDTK